MSETPEQRAARIRDWAADRRDCARCGLKRINVVHEPDPKNAPEGRRYYAAFADQLHRFVEPR